MDKLGNVGISNTKRQARLHINDPNSLPNSKYFSNAVAIFEYGSFGNTALQLMCRAGSNYSIFSGTDSTFRRSSIEFSNDSSLRFIAGASASLTPDLMIAKNGAVGINTSTPAALFDASGSFKLGTNGTVNAALIQEAVNINVGSIPANGELDVTIAVANVATAAAVSVSPSADLNSGIIIAWARVSSAGNVRIRFRNLTGGAINPAAIDYYISAVQ